jgi:hypothetical protein
MIGAEYFYDWMIHKKGLGEETAKTNLARIKRINTVYDLFYEYLKDECAYVLSLFEYSSEDMELGLEPEHDVVINGNYYTGTQSLKYALKLYIEAQQDDNYFDGWIKASANADEAAAFEETLRTCREMGTITDAEVRGMMRELEAEQKSETVSKVIAEKMPVTEEPTKTGTFTGSLQVFLRYVGPFCKNYVNSIAKAARNKHKGICEYCGKKAVLDSAHKDGEDRPVIIKRILETHFKKSEDYYEVDVLEFEKLFKKAHSPIEDHIFFLCKECHTEYDRGTKITTADILANRKG